VSENGWVSEFGNSEEDKSMFGSFAAETQEQEETLHWKVSTRDLQFHLLSKLYSFTRSRPTFWNPSRMQSFLSSPMQSDSFFTVTKYLPIPLFIRIWSRMFGIKGRYIPYQNIGICLIVGKGPQCALYFSAHFELNFVRLPTLKSKKITPYNIPSEESPLISWGSYFKNVDR